MPKRIEEIVRVMETDLDGNKPVDVALRQIRGIGFQMSKAILTASGFSPGTKLKELSEKDIEKLESIIKNPAQSGIPNWMVNRRKDLETGKDIHVASVDLGLYQRSDIDRMKKLRTWKGIRHGLGQPVRGQRTKSSFRTSGAVVGVSRKAVKAAARAVEKEKARPSTQTAPPTPTPQKTAAAETKPAAKEEKK